MRRRDVLRALGLMALGSRSLAPRPAFGVPAPEISRAVQVPETLRADSILEIFLIGGVSHYESFYCVPEHGRTDRTHYHLYADTAAMAAAREACGIAGPPIEYFARDGAGQDVHLGPFAAPLRARPDIRDRTRVSIVRHALAPHEAAIPLALSGRGLGSPSLAGLGAHVQRHHGGLASYVIKSSSLGPIPIDNLRALVATGLHPGAARPLDVTVDAAGDLAALLERPAVRGRRAAHDALAAAYAERFRDRLRWRGVGGPLRAPHLQDLLAATRTLEDADGIARALDPSAWSLGAGTSCGHTQTVDAVGAQLRLAARLLTQPTRPARYVCVVDGGFVPLTNGGGGYDSHADNTLVQSRNLSHTLRTLVDLIQKPGEVTPGKLDLARTLIVLTTEFGRSPTSEGGSGRNHWPYGYSVVLMGGPIRAPGVVGAIDASGQAIVHARPQHSRMAALLALGIWPFSPEGFNVSDVDGAATEEHAAAQLLERELGIV